MNLLTFFWGLVTILSIMGAVIGFLVLTGWTTRPPSWHKMADEKPPKDSMYLVFAPTADPKMPFRWIAWWSLENQRWEMIVSIFAEAITHWMEYPESPSQKE